MPLKIGTLRVPWPAGLSKFLIVPSVFWFNSLRSCIILALSLAAFVPKAGAQVQVIEFSDSHSSYDRLALFLRNFDQITSDYLNSEPSGKIVVIVNGDFAGISSSSDENGWFGVRTLAQLANVASVVYTPGNHDGFDWGVVGYGNRLMNRQLEFLKKSGVHIVARNYRLDSDVTEPYFDLQMASGAKIRFAGFGLEEIFKKSAIQVDALPKIILSTAPIADAMREVAVEAIRDRVENLIFFQHDSQANLRSNLQALDSTMGLELGKAGVSIPVAFAAHDHLRKREVMGRTLLLDSRSNFDFSVVELGAEGERKSDRFFDRPAQTSQLRESRAPKFPQLEKMARAIEKKVEAQRLRSSQVVGHTGGFTDIKVDLKTGRAELGTVLADSLKAWGQASRPQSSASLPIVAFYNSSSFRRDEPILPGKLVIGTLETFYPFPGDARLFLASGDEIDALFSALRAWRLNEDGMYTPQMSRGLSEARDKLGKFSLNFNDQPLDSNGKYLLVLDSWLSRNGYKIEVFMQFLKSHPVLAAKDMTAIFKSYAPQVMMNASPDLTCRNLFQPGP